MCVDSSNVPPEDLTKFKAFTDSLSDGPLKEFLAPIAEVLAEGGGFCLAIAPPMGEPPDEPGPPPGIYPV